MQMYGKFEVFPFNCANIRYTLPETNIFAPENGWLEYFLGLPFGARCLFSGANLAVSFREGNECSHLFFKGPLSQKERRMRVMSYRHFL